MKTARGLVLGSTGTFTAGAVRGIFRGDCLLRWNRLELLAAVRWQYGRLVAPLLTDDLIGGGRRPGVVCPREA